MDPLLKAIIDLIKPHCEFAFLVGSFGTPRFTKDSDLDLAVYFAESVDWDLKLILKEQLENLVSRDVDLVDLRTADPIFARQILENGRLLFSKNNHLLMEWKIKSLSLYIDLKMGRSEIEKNLLKRTKING